MGDQRRGPSGPKQGSIVEIVGVRVADLRVGDHPDADSLHQPSLSALDSTLVQRDGGGGAALQVDLGEVGASGHRRREQLLDPTGRERGRGERRGKGKVALREGSFRRGCHEGPG